MVSTRTTRRRFRPSSPLAPVLSGWRHRRLIRSLVARELQARYRGSLLGTGWTIVLPLLMLTTYTFVFVGIFHNSNQEVEGQKLDFTLALFVGLIVFTLFSEVFIRSPGLLLENVSFLKKVPFPVEVLPWISISVALVNAAIAFTILILFYLVRIGVPPPSALAVPVILAPLVMVLMGLSWFLASAGVFLRDLRPLMGPVSNLIMFLSPVFYPLSALPERFRPFMYWNPLTIPIQDIKVALFLGRLADPLPWLGSLCVGAVVMWFGYWWFEQTRHAFADVV